MADSIVALTESSISIPCWSRHDTQQIGLGLASIASLDSLAHEPTAAEVAAAVAEARHSDVLSQVSMGLGSPEDHHKVQQILQMTTADSENSKAVRQILAHADPNSPWQSMLGGGGGGCAQAAAQPQERVRKAKFVEVGDRGCHALALNVQAVVAAVELECEARSGLVQERGYTGDAPLPTRDSDFYGGFEYYEALTYVCIQVARECCWSRGGTGASSNGFVLPFISPHTDSFVTFEINDNSSRLRQQAEPGKAYNYDVTADLGPFVAFNIRVAAERGLVEDCTDPVAVKNVLQQMEEMGSGDVLRRNRVNQEYACHYA